MWVCNILGILKEVNGKWIKISYYGMNLWMIRLYYYY